MKRRFNIFLSLLAVTAIYVAAFDSSYYTAKSKLSSGKWVKVRTTAEGIYQLTYGELERLGFDNPSKVQVYGYGAPTSIAMGNEFDTSFPDDITAVPVRHTADGRLLFYGQGDAYIESTFSSDYSKSNNNSNYFNAYRTPYDTCSYYFLSDFEGKVKMPGVRKETANVSFQPLTSHICVDFIEKEERNYTSGGVLFHGPTHEPGETTHYTFRIKDFKPTAVHKAGSFYYNYGLRSPEDVKLSSDADPKVTVSESPYNKLALKIDYTTVDAYRDVFGFLTFNYDNAPEGETDLTFSVTVPAANIDYCAEDYVMLRYPRANKLDKTSPFLLMNFPNKENLAGQPVMFDGIDTGDIELWKIDTPVPQSFTPTYNAKNKTATFVLDGKTKRAVSFRPSLTSFPSPEIVGAVENQNLHGLATPEMLIITTSELEPAAKMLADVHRQYQGMDVAVVVHDDVYNEFSSGARDAMAYRRLAKMFYDRNPGKFRHILFFGPAYFDNRCVISAKADRLVCYEQDNPDLCKDVVATYATDMYFGMLADNYRHSDILTTPAQVNVGRVSCMNLSEGRTYVDKVRNRFVDPMPAEVYNNIILMAGRGDTTIHSIQAEEVRDYIRNTVSPTFSFSMIPVEIYNQSSSDIQRKALAAALQRGSGYMAYIGHGGATYIDGWSTSDVTVTDYPYVPFTMFSSCGQYTFDQLSNGLMHTMMFAPDGGTLGGVAAGRGVYIECNQMTCLPVSLAYAQSKPGDTFGDIFRRSRDIGLEMVKNELNPAPTLMTLINLMSYNMAGDPAIPVGVPEYGATLTAVNGQNVSGVTTALPMENTEFRGTIAKNGKTATDFSGSVRIEVLDGLHRVNTINYNGEADYTPNEIELDNDILAVAFGEVKNGVFTATTAIPVPAFPADTYRVIISAISDNGTAIGLYDKLKIGTFAPDKFDASKLNAPSIKEFYAGEPTFVSGDVVSASTVLHAVVDPSESGLSMMNGNIGSRTRISIDGTPRSTNLDGMFRRRSDGLLDLTVPLKDLSDGLHEIELCVMNNAGLMAREVIEVLTSTDALKPELEVAERPASTTATISMNNGEDTEYVRLQVTDASGNAVVNIENPTFPYKWNLKDSLGKDVTDGLYRVSAIVRSGRFYGSAASTEITVLR